MSCINQKHTYKIGDTYGILKLIELYRNKNENNRLYAKVECTKCHKIRCFRASQLFGCKCTSCMCQSKNGCDNNHKLYSVYYNMLDRCSNKNCHAYKNYGGRGITICDEWKYKNGYNNFYEWALKNGYKDGLSIDRIDNDGNYEPANCQWITKYENLAKANKINKRRHNNKGLKYYAVSPNNEYYEFEFASEFAREHNLRAGTIRKAANNKKKLKNGWKFGFVE